MKSKDWIVAFATTGMLSFTTALVDIIEGISFAAGLKTPVVPGSSVVQLLMGGIFIYFVFVITAFRLYQILKNHREIAGESPANRLVITRSVTKNHWEIVNKSSRNCGRIPLQLLLRGVPIQVQLQDDERKG